MDKFQKLYSQKRKEDNQDKLKSEYIINNINDLHNLLNQKENNVKNLKNVFKLLLKKKNLEFNNAIKEKNKEISQIKNSENNPNLSIFREFADCLEQASDQFDNKDKKIKELLNIIDDLQKKYDLP